jgi:amyloid beta precursor protein binding protein 1
MLGYLRIFKKESYIIETKDKENPFKRDLRCAQPWPELLEFANSFNLDTLVENEQIHVPYAVILIQAANVWRASHEGLLPKTFAEKGQFKQ